MYFLLIKGVEYSNYKNNVFLEINLLFLLGLGLMVVFVYKYVTMCTLLFISPVFQFGKEIIKVIQNVITLRNDQI